MGASGSFLSCDRGAVAPEPASLPSSGVEAKSKDGDGASWEEGPEGAKNPTAFEEGPQGCLRDAAGFSTAPPGSSPPPPASRTSKLKTRSAEGRPIFSGRCRSCGWETRALLYVLWKHPFTCDSDSSKMVHEATERAHLLEEAKKAQRQAHIRGRHP